LYDLSQDQLTGSYWTSSLLTTTKGGRYLILSHVLGNVCKSSILEVDTLNYWNDLEYGTVPNSTVAPSEEPGFHLAPGNCGLGSTSDDNISNMYTYGATDKYSYNITWEGSTSKVLLNGGNGAFTFAPGFVNSTEWSIPAARTSGTFTLEGQEHHIDSKKSLTWYDHQKGMGAPQSWTWFQLHFPGSSIKASVWAYDLPSSSPDTIRFATVRVGEESQYILPFDMKTKAHDTWVSPRSNITYPLSWRLDFENGDHLNIKSARADQEIYGPRALSDTVYAGYATVSGRFLGRTVGYGVVEMIKLF
jgi:hypothetical protein